MVDFRTAFEVIFNECSTISLLGDASYAEIWLNTFFHEKWGLRTKTPLHRGSHQDFVVIDGKQDSPEDVRELIPSMSQYPTAIPVKIYYVRNFQSLHRNSWSAFLKVFEEPFPHVRFLIPTQEALPGTIESRCIPVRLPMPDRTEIGKILQETGFDEPQFRAEVCGRSLSVAQNLKIDIVRKFQKEWQSYFGGGSIKPQQLVSWLEDLRGERETEEACFNVLVRLVSKRAFKDDILSKGLVEALIDWSFEGRDFMEAQKVRVSLRRCLAVAYTRDKRKNANP